ncbi:MAG: glycosyltransferase [Rhodospirillaceae bacterium]
MSAVLIAASGLSLAIWLHLLFFHGRFWRCDQRLDEDGPPPAAGWPEVVVVVPARNEATVIGQSLGSLLHQDYRGRFRIVLVDDHSEDGTRAIADQVAVAANATRRLAVTGARPLPAGWSGKLWAVSEGVTHAAELAPEARYLLLTDADISHDAGSLSRLVARAEAERLDLVSLMVLLDHNGFWAGLLIPAFVFFFQKLYPFPWVNSPGHPMAAAAGGCILVRRQALEAAGGIARIRGALIDDCTLGAVIKAGPGRIWLGLTSRLISLRPYTRFGEIWDMVARTAYTQLRYSPLLLLGTVSAMALTYLAAPLAVLTAPLHQVWLAAALGLAAWGLIVVAYRPTLTLYGKPAAAALLLPMVGFLYSLMTVASAARHWRGRGGQWKGRTYQASPAGGDCASAAGAGREAE